MWIIKISIWLNLYLTMKGYGIFFAKWTWLKLPLAGLDASEYKNGSVRAGKQRRLVRTRRWYKIHQSR